MWRKGVYMWPTASSRSRFGVSIFALSAVLFLLAAQPSSAAAFRVAHPRIRRAVPKTAIPPPHVEPTTAEPRIHETDIQDWQTTLAKQTADFDAVVQRRLNELSLQLGDSQRKMQLALEQADQRLGLTETLLKFVIALLVLLLGGLLYVANQLPRRGGNSVKWKGKIPEVDIDTEEEGIVSWQKGEPSNDPVSKPGIGKDTQRPPAPIQF
jgi:hypothetical protein